jgi:hypothetical protein
MFLGRPLWFSPVQGGNLPGVDFVRQAIVENGFEAPEKHELVAMRDLNGRYYVVRLIPHIAPYEREGFAIGAATRPLYPGAGDGCGYVVPDAKPGKCGNKGSPSGDREFYRHLYLGAHFIQVAGRGLNRYSDAYAGEVTRANAQMMEDGSVIALKQLDTDDEIILRCDDLMTAVELAQSYHERFGSDDEDEAEAEAIVANAEAASQGTI